MEIPKKVTNYISSGLFLLSASSLAMEVALTRLFSFLYTHSYVYIIISISMAGLGLGAVFMSILPERARMKILRFMIPLPGLLLIIIILSGINQGAIYLSLIATMLLFFCIGIFQIVVFQKFDIETGKLYAADLSGAALGSIAVFAILNLTGALYTAIILTALVSTSFVIIYILRFRQIKEIIFYITAAACLVAALFISATSSSLLPQKSLMKEMTIMLEDNAHPAVISETRWSAFGRVDVVETDNPLFKTLFIDGAAGTKMIKMENASVDNPTAETLLYKYMGGVPLLGIDDSNKDRALILGSGGGIDVVTALLTGYKEIDAVEINPDFIAITEDDREYNGGIYTDNEQVNLIKGEGRSFIKSTENKYNLLHMSLPIIKSARNLGNQSLTENYLFTYNAFGEYMEKLENNGIILILAHYPNELMKLAVNAAAAMEKSGMASEEIMKHIITLGADNSPVILIKKTPFTLEETQLYYTILDQMELRGSTNFIPGFSQRSKPAVNRSGENIKLFEFNPGLYNYSTGEWNLEKIVEVNSENIGIVSDNSPFFYQMNKAIPKEIRMVAIIAGLLLAGSFILFTFRKILKIPQEKRKINMGFLLSFGAIGAGYMLIEISYLQKFIFYWQHQTLALSVVLSTILIFSGAGSYISYRLKAGKFFHIILGSLLFILILNAFIINPVLNSTASGIPALKFLMTFLIVGPPFLLMGMPFPIMLEMNSRLIGSKNDFPWMMGFNSLASLSGGVYSMVIAINTGYWHVLAVGIVLYLIPLLFSLFRKAEYNGHG